jgi:uncharacterized protein YbjT (DUF2867 family)
LFLESREQPVKRTVAMAGATGLVGRSILEGLLADASVQSVHVLGRRKPRHARITGHIVDFAALPPLPPIDEVYLALGTTIKVAGSQAAFRAIDFDANLAVARAALAAGARRCGLVSAIGANAKSSVFYNRVKGELEEALAQIPFEGLVIARPSLLIGNRASLGQPERPLEKISAIIHENLRPAHSGQLAGDRRSQSRTNHSGAHAGGRRPGRGDIWRHASQLALAKDSRHLRPSPIRQ